MLLDDGFVDACRRRWLDSTSFKVFVFCPSYTFDHPKSGLNGWGKLAHVGSHTLPEKPLVVIRSRSSNLSFNLQELWSHRELLYFLAWRDVKVRYKQTV